MRLRFEACIHGASLSASPPAVLISVAQGGHGSSPENGGKAWIPTPTPLSPSCLAAWPQEPEVHLNRVCRGDSPVLLRVLFCFGRWLHDFFSLLKFSKLYKLYDFYTYVILQ